MSPAISVIMPVHDGEFTLDREIRSVIAQQFADWEIVAVDDGSSDDTPGILQRWSAADCRIHFSRFEENRGVAAARNAAIALAQGEMIAFLDRDDEYYPSYLNDVQQLADRADMLVFGYDYVYQDGSAEGRLPAWNPAAVAGELFLQNIVMPLGVAQHRSWWEKAGGFHENCWQPDWDYWKRLVRAGARLEFPPLKSGRYHVRLTGTNRRPHVTARQREAMLENWRQGKPMFGAKSLLRNQPKCRKVAFVSAHCAIDPTNGAATSTLDALALLAESGFDCHVYCCSHLDSLAEVAIEDVLDQAGARYGFRDVTIGNHQAQLVQTAHRDVPVTLSAAASSRQWAGQAEADAFLAVCDQFLKEQRPQVVWTYGGDPDAHVLQRLAKRLDIPVLFALHNFCYFDPVAFVASDYVMVFSEYSRKYYWDSLRLACQKVPLVIDPRRVEVPQWQPQYLTFVNPEPRKGVHVFARIAEVLSLRRPDIPLLLVEGAFKAGILPQLGVDLGRLPNLKVVPNSPDPRKFLATTKLLLMPSLMENAALLATEAMLNGIPVLASNRGGLPETIGQAGFLFDIPARYTTETRAIPTEAEVAPWVEAIIRLWDDPSWYAQWSQAARDRGRLSHPDHLRPVYREFFENLFVQPAPPLIP